MTESRLVENPSVEMMVRELSFDLVRSGIEITSDEHVHNNASAWPQSAFNRIAGYRIELFFEAKSWPPTSIAMPSSSRSFLEAHLARGLSCGVAFAPKLATPTLMIADHMIGAASDAPKRQPNPVRKAGGERSVKAANHYRSHQETNVQSVDGMISPRWMQATGSATDAPGRQIHKSVLRRSKADCNHKIN